MYKYLDGTWGEFEVWIREKIGSGFRWRVRPMDTRTNRKMVADLIVKDVERGDGVFPGKNAFIEKT